MKKYLYLMMAGVIAISCAKEIEPNTTAPGISGERQEITFHAGNTQTKTILSEGTAVLWAPEDALTVFDSERANNKFSQSSLSDDLASASFTGQAAKSDIYYAVYPYRAGNASSSAGVINTYLSPDQFAVADSFGPGANLSMGVSTTVNGASSFVMQQVGAFIKFSFNGCSNITSICLKAIGGEKIAGGVTATCSEGVFNAVSNNDGSALDEVTLYPAAGSEYIAEGTYYVVVLPVTLNSGLQIIFTEKTDGVEKVISAKVESPIELAKNTVSALPAVITLPDVSNPAWMAQETISVLFKEPQHLLDGEGTASLPFAAPQDYEGNTVTVDGYSIDVNFGTKTPSLSSENGFSITAGTNNGWHFSLPVISGKKLAKVEYYTSNTSGTNSPCVTNQKKGYEAIYGAVNNAGSAYSKYIWNLNLSNGCWLTWYGDETHKGNVSLNGFRAIYRDIDGPAKAVVSASTDSYGAFVDQDVVLSGSFVAYDATATGYTYGFEYKSANASPASYSPKRASAGESFNAGQNYVLRSEQSGEWTSIDGSLESGTTFTATLNSLARGQAYTVRAWARVGTEGDKVYGSEQEIYLLSKVSSGTEWKHGENEFFTIWRTCSNTYSDNYNYHWEDKLKDGSISSYKYGADGLLYETTATAVEFREKSYLKFGPNQTFSFISAESGTATLTMICKSTGNSARNIYVAVNDERVDTFGSSVSDYSQVNSNEFAVKEGDKVSITINNNANLQYIAFACVAQEASFDVSVDDNSKSDRNNLYNFTVAASSDLQWNVEASAGTLSKTSGNGNDTFTLTVPVNYEWGDGVNYTVTISTSDERIAAGNRTQVINLTQAQPTKVLFGCKWGSSFLSAWNTSGFTANTEYTAQLATAKASSSLTTGNSGYMRGNPTFVFTAGESGKASLTFKARVYSQANKTNYFKVYKGSTQVGEIKAENASVTTDLAVNFDVLAGDEIKITYSGTSGNHYLYCGDANPITWSLAE